MKSMEKIISRRGAETRSNWNAIVASTVDALINTLGLFCMLNLQSFASLRLCAKIPLFSDE